MKFEEKLMTLRKSKGWSQEDLANQIGVSRQTISKWESSQTTPEMNKLKELSKIFEISVDELINNENKEEKEEEKSNEKVFDKINLKSTNILLIIACILIVIGLVVGIVLYRKSKETKDVYVEDIIMITYSFMMEEKVDVIEIYSFNGSNECIGTNIYVKAINKIDYDAWVKEITTNKINADYMVYNISLTDNEISWLSTIYEKESKENILKGKENFFSEVQDLQIIDM